MGQPEMATENSPKQSKPAATHVSHLLEGSLQSLNDRETQKEEQVDPAMAQTERTPKDVQAISNYQKRESEHNVR